MRAYKHLIGVSASLLTHGADVAAQARAASTSFEISARDLHTRLSIVADDSMEGRAAGSSGARRTQQYIMTELRRLGLEPGGHDGAFQQTATIVIKRIAGAALAPEGGSALRLWSDFAPLPWAWKTKPIDSVRVIYGGELGNSPLTPEQLAGRFVIFRQPQGRNVLPRVAPGDPLKAAAVVAVLGMDSSDARLQRMKRGLEAGLLGDPALSQVVPVAMVLRTPVAEMLFSRPLADLHPGDTGVVMRGAVTIGDSLAPLCCNILARIPGHDPTLSHQYVALGAHLDHLGMGQAAADHDSLHAAAMSLWALKGNSSAGTASLEQERSIRVDTTALRRVRPARRDSIFNGADDDGSGTAALLEIAEYLMQPARRPARSILLVWHTGEELGNQGSTWLTEHSPVPLDSIVAQLNVDMIGRGSALDVTGGGPRYVQVIGARRQSSELAEHIDAVNRRQRDPFSIDYQYDSPTDRRHYFCRSDHFEYARFGIPIAFFTTGEHADYHRVTDEVSYIDFPHYAAVTRFIADVAIDLASSRARPRLTEPRPDPAAGCRG